MRSSTTGKAMQWKRLLLILLCVGLICGRFIVSPPASSAAGVKRSAVGATPADIQATIDQFRADLGGVNNGIGGGFLSGRREINWDDVPDNLAAPNNLPDEFTLSRGLALNPLGGTGLQVSMDDNNPADADGDQVRFDNLNPSYSARFQNFSPQRLFTPLGSNTTQITFFVPGTSIPATVNGFGAVFTDVDSVIHQTVISYFDQTGTLLDNQVLLPANNGLSFAGISFNAGERIASVRIQSGSVVVGADDVDGPTSASDVVVMDDFIYSEPQPTTNSVFFRWTGAGADNKWSTPQNWAGGVAPAPGPNVRLEFPNGAAQLTNVNDFGTQLDPPTFHSITISGSGYDLKSAFSAGQQLGGIKISGVRAANQSGNNKVSMGVIVPAEGSFSSGAAGTTLTFDGGIIPIAANNPTMTFDGPGDVVFNGTAITGAALPASLVKNGSGRLLVGGSLGQGYIDSSVRTIVNNGTMVFSSLSSTTSVTLNGGTLATSSFEAPVSSSGGQGRMGPIAGEGGTIAPGGLNGHGILLSGGALASPFGSPVPGFPFLTIGGLTLDSATTLDLELNGTNPGGLVHPGGVTPTQFDRLEVVGPIDLGGSVLNLHLNFTPAETDQMMIINNRDNPVTDREPLHFTTIGTFKDLPEGAIFPVNGSLFKITYRGGDGNDVVLTGVPKVSITDVTVTEGNAGTTNAIFTVSLSSSSNQTITVDFGTIDGTASAGSDYGPRSGTRIFNPGQISQTITIPVNGDTVGEADETFFIVLSDPLGTVITQGIGLGKIVNDDGPSATPSLSINNPTVTEGDIGVSNATFTVTLSAASSQPVTVDYFTSNGSATAPGDYEFLSGTLTFNPGQTTRSITVSVVGDGIAEPTENFFVNLSTPGGATIATLQGTGTINDNDASNTFQFSAATSAASESAGSITVTVTRTGDTSGAASVKFETGDLTATQRSDYTFGAGTVKFEPGETSKAVKLLLVNDAFAEGNETFAATLSSPSSNSSIGSVGSVVITITDDDAVLGATNPIDDAQFFVRQQYLDFLGREPDASGFQFWTDQIIACGSDPGCLSNRRVSVSAAFFLSIEFQETSGNVLRSQRVAFGRKSNEAASRVPYLEFMRDTRQIGQGVIVGQAGYQALLEQNKQAYAEQIVASDDFNLRFPVLPAAQFVDSLFASAGVTPTADERTAALNAFGQGGTSGRVAALRTVADSSSLRAAELTPSFVLAQYDGYLRRNPTDAPDFNDTGYQFWLNKLNSFNGDFRKAEMVKAFITSNEYRQRFGR